MIRLPSIRNTTMWMLIAAALLAFVPINYLVERQLLFKSADSVLFATGIGAAIGFSVGAWNSLWLPPHKMTAADLAIVATFMGGIFIAWIFAGQWYWRAMGKPDGIIDSVWLLFPRYGLATSMAIMMSASFSKDGTIAIGVAGRMAALIAAAICVAGVLIGIGIG